MPVEIIVPDHIASFALQTFGRLATPRTYDLEKLRTLRDQTPPPRTERLRIQGDATLAGLLAVWRRPAHLSVRLILAC